MEGPDVFVTGIGFLLNSVCMCVCVYVCMCVCEVGKEEKRILE